MKRIYALYPLLAIVLIVLGVEGRAAQRNARGGRGAGAQPEPVQPAPVKPGDCGLRANVAASQPTTLEAMTKSLPVIVLARVQSVVHEVPTGRAIPQSGTDVLLTVSEVLKGPASLRQIVVLNLVNLEECKAAADGQQYVLFLSESPQTGGFPAREGFVRYQIYTLGVFSANSDAVYTWRETAHNIEGMKLPDILKVIRSNIAKAQ